MSRAEAKEDRARSRGQDLQFEPLPRSFYLPSARQVAPRLLGHWLVRRTPEGPCGGLIVETEAYLRDDPACHGAPGLTRRNRVMFGEPGHAYVYFIYGNHHCMNTVCQPPGVAEAVLIRALEPAFGEQFMRARRRLTEIHRLTDGPGKLCEALAIDRKLDGADLCDASGPLFIARNPGLPKVRRELGPVITTVRVGLTRAADLPLRYYLAHSPFVSRQPRRPQSP